MLSLIIAPATARIFTGHYPPIYTWIFQEVIPIKFCYKSLYSFQHCQQKMHKMNAQ
jgi:hypothetical protein